MAQNLSVGGGKNVPEKANTGSGALDGIERGAPSRAAGSAQTTPTGKSTSATRSSTRRAGSGLSKAEEYEILLAQVEDCRLAGWQCGIRRVLHKGRLVLVISVWDVPNNGEGGVNG